MYQSFFDLSYESLPTQFADYFPPNEPLHIWLRGTPAQLAPFLASGGEKPGPLIWRLLPALVLAQWKI
ncbi:MAG: hypothetical protein M5U34_12945 [Chloroflexi bacterium]|nr:hypothetical protein [Chloroflexota bacterium]